MLRAIRTMLLPAICMMLAFPPAHADDRPPEVARSLADAQLVGKAPYQVLGWTVFDAALWADGGDFAWDRPFALSLTYRGDFSARSMADRSMREMSRRGAVAQPDRLRDLLLACFADVTHGDRITGVSTGPNTASFYLNAQSRCAIEHKGVSRAFFSIWLDASGSQRRFSKRLLGAD